MGHCSQGGTRPAGALAMPPNSCAFRDFAIVFGESNPPSPTRLRCGGRAHHRVKVGRMIRAANQRTGIDAEKTFSTPDVAVIIELVRLVIFDDLQMLHTPARVL